MPLLHPSTDHVAQPEHDRRRLFHLRGNGVAAGVDEDRPALAVRVALLPAARRMVVHFHAARAPPPPLGRLRALVLGRAGAPDFWWWQVRCLGLGLGVCRVKEQPVIERCR